MPHHTPLIGTIVIGLGFAFLMGALAHRLRVSPVAGYLLAGVIVGPFTPGYVADTALAAELAELGVILLMFGVGLHFSLRDLLSVRRTAVPGAVAQIAAATLMGMGMAQLLGWTLLAGFVFGLALSVASTVVLIRALQARGIVETERGRIAVGWLIVEDVVMVLAIVILPVVADLASGVSVGAAAFGSALLFTALKVTTFVILMLVVGKRVIPAVLHWVAHTGSRELFRLAVLSLALGVAFGSAVLFDVSFALGAFFAGMILGETRLSQRAAEETLPLRDAFAVLFFVSVGMLFDPAILLEQPLQLLATVGIIILGKSIIAYGIVRAFGHPNATALTISASLAQIGEFSFILASLGVGLGLLPKEGRDLILAGAIVSILLNPIIFTFIEKHPDGLKHRRAGAKDIAAPAAGEQAQAQAPTRPGHVVMIGYGRVGSLVGPALIAQGRRLLVVEEEQDIAEKARREGAEVIVGNAADPRVLGALDLAHAAKLIIAIPESYDAGQIAEQARAQNPDLPIIARAHSEEGVRHLSRLGARHVIMGEREIAAKMLDLVSEAGRQAHGA